MVMRKLCLSHVTPLYQRLLLSCTLIAAILPAGASSGIAAEVVRTKRALASGTHGQGQPANAVDGIVSDDSRWIGSGSPPWLVLELDGNQLLSAADIYSGFELGSPVQSMRVQSLTNGKWIDIPGGHLIDNDQLGIRIVFEKPIETEKLRFWFENPGPQQLARIREIELWRDSPSKLPALKEIETIDQHPTFPANEHLIFLNQSGFNLDWPKRFTAPLSPDGTEFRISPLTDNRVLYVGEIQNRVGDFSNFRPGDPELLYRVHVKGGSLSPGESDSFYVAPMLFQRVALEPALRMFVDDRSATGSHPGAFGCAPWRDSPFYAYSTPSLVNLYLSNPSFFNQIKVEMDFIRDLDRVLDPAFAFDDHCAENAMEILQRMRKEIAPPVGQGVPDILQLIHWGTAWWHIDPVSKDWAGSEEKLHPETIAIPAFFLYGYPAFSQYFKQDYYESIRDSTFGLWESAGLFDLQTNIGTFKGRYAPGWTVLPNLMMYEVAEREGRNDSGRFLDIAVSQAEWVIETVNLNNPLHTKGQRISEHKTISGLVVLQKHYPEVAPEGIVDFLRQWADVMIKRSNNLWDFRKYDDEHWSLPRHMPGMTGGGSSWNEPGNLAGFPYLAWSVASVLGDEPGDEDRQKRLEQLAVSHFDNLWGRNPLGAHSSWRGPKDYLGVERGWPVKYRPICGYLHTARGALCSSASSEHYPFNPQGDFRHPEGWTAFNAAFNMGLVAANHRDTRLQILGREGKSITKINDELIVELAAPVFGPSAEVSISCSSGDRETLNLTATDYQQHRFRGRIPVTSHQVAKDDATLQCRSGDNVTVSYGYGYFATSIQMPVQ